MQEKLFETVQSTLENQGILNPIKAQIRANVFKILSNLPGQNLPAQTKSKTFFATKNGKLVYTLIKDLLEKLGLKESLYVFENESDSKEDSTMDLYTTMNELNLVYPSRRESKDDSEIVLLDLLIQSAMNEKHLTTEASQTLKDQPTQSLDDHSFSLTALEKSPVKTTDQRKFDNKFEVSSSFESDPLDSKKDSLKEYYPSFDAQEDNTNDSSFEQSQEKSQNSSFKIPQKEESSFDIPSYSNEKDSTRALQDQKETKYDSLNKDNATYEEDYEEVEEDIEEEFEDQLSQHDGVNESELNESISHQEGSLSNITGNQQNLLGKVDNENDAKKSSDSDILGDEGSHTRLHMNDIPASAENSSLHHIEDPIPSQINESIQSNSFSASESDIPSLPMDSNRDPNNASHDSQRDQSNHDPGLNAAPEDPVFGGNNIAEYSNSLSASRKVNVLSKNTHLSQDQTEDELENSSSPPSSAREKLSAKRANVSRLQQSTTTRSKVGWDRPSEVSFDDEMNEYDLDASQEAPSHTQQMVTEDLEDEGKAVNTSVNDSIEEINKSVLEDQDDLSYKESSFVDESTGKVSNLTATNNLFMAPSRDRVNDEQKQKSVELTEENDDDNNEYDDYGDDFEEDDQAGARPVPIAANKDEGEEEIDDEYSIEEDIISAGYPTSEDEDQAEKSQNENAEESSAMFRTRSGMLPQPTNQIRFDEDSNDSPDELDAIEKKIHQMEADDHEGVLKDIKQRMQFGSNQSDEENSVISENIDVMEFSTGEGNESDSQDASF